MCLTFHRFALAAPVDNSADTILEAGNVENTEAGGGGGGGGGRGGGGGGRGGEGEGVEVGGVEVGGVVVMAVVGAAQDGSAQDGVIRSISTAGRFSGPFSLDNALTMQLVNGQYLIH